MTIGVTAVWAAPEQYTNCDFKVEPYEEVCKKVVEKGVTYQYANEFLLSAKAKERDMVSLELFSPKKITVHAANEKRANNALVMFIPDIVEHLKQYAEVYDYAEAKYHVNREIIAAILAKETRLGKFKPSHDAFIVFNTLVREIKPVSKRDKRLMKMAKENMVSIMSYCYEKQIAPSQCDFSSSYAGAVGIPQFMPQNFGHIEGYKTPIGNLSHMEDAIVSASRFLHYNSGFDTLMDWSKIPPMVKVENDWYDYDFENKNSSFVYAKSNRTGKNYNCFSCDKPELQYLREYIKKIMNYNNSSNYAVGVMRLAYDAHEKLNVKD